MISVGHLCLSFLSVLVCFSLDFFFLWCFFFSGGGGGCLVVLGVLCFGVFFPQLGEMKDSGDFRLCFLCLGGVGRCPGNLLGLF